MITCPRKNQLQATDLPTDGTIGGREWHRSAGGRKLRKLPECA